jgi:hypothetical protein
MECPLGDTDSTVSSTEKAFPILRKHRADVTVHEGGYDISKLIDVTVRLPGPNVARVGAVARGVKERHYGPVFRGGDSLHLNSFNQWYRVNWKVKPLGHCSGIMNSSGSEGVRMLRCGRCPRHIQN